MKPKWVTHAAAGCADPAFGPGWGYPWDGPAGSLQEPRVGGPRVLGRWLGRVGEWVGPTVGSVQWTMVV